MSLKKYLLAGGLSTMLLLGACGLGDGEEEEGSSEEESSEESADTESEDTGDADASEDESEDSADDSDSEDDSSDAEDNADSEDDSSDAEDDADSEGDSSDTEEDSGDDSDEEDSVDVDSDEDDSSIGIGGTEDLDEEDVDEEASDESDDEDATNGEEQTKTFVLEENGTYNELVYYYVGDEVKRQTSVTEMDYEAIGASNEEEAQELLSDASQEYTDTDGVEHDIEYNDDGFVETTEVNYDEADLNEVAGLDGADFEGDDSAEFVSMERSEEQLLSAGYELVEGEAVSDTDSGSGSESSSGESSESESTAGGIDFSTITGETLTGDDTEITSMFIGNSGIAELLDSAEESDADIEEVLKPSEETTTYFAETYMVIHAFGAGSDTPAESDVAGLSAEIDERDGFEVFSQVYDKESGKLLPNIYADPDQFAAFDGTGWIDQTGTAESEEVFYGSYSNLHEAFMENSDVIDVSEDDDYYFLHNIGDEESLHETFGSIFNVEYTGANTDEMENAVVGIVEKSSGDLVHVAYISTAPGQENPDETLHIEIAEQIDKYGEYDDSGVTVPDVQENPAPDEEDSSGSGSEEESSGSTQDGLTIGDSAELEGFTLTVEDSSYTDERNDFAEVDADEVIMLELSFENNSGDSYLMGSRDMEVMLDGEPAETYPVGDIILDETADGESTTGTLAYAVTGDPSEIELVFSPLDAEDSAVFNVTPE